MKYKGILASSSDPAELSRTIQGLVLGASSIIIFVAVNVFNINIGTDDVITLASGLGAAGGGIWVIYGLFLKVINRVGRE